MTSLRFTTVVLTCLALALPLNAFSPCCCTLGNPSPNCTCSTPETGSCCCNTTQCNDGSCCSHGETDCCKSTCNCSVLTENHGIVVSESKHRVDLSTFAYPFAISDATPVHSIALRSSLDRPPIRHNQRQATLCVWRK